MHQHHQSAVLVRYFVLALVASYSTSVVFARGPSAAAMCPDGVEGISCMSATIARKVFKDVLQLADSGTGNGASSAGTGRHVFGGVELIHVPNSSTAAGDTNLNASSSEELGRDLTDSLLNKIKALASSYELRLKLSELLSVALGDDAESEGRKGGGLGGLGGDKKKGGGAMLMMMMMGGMMKMMAMGALGMLAMKALAVSSLAFMLSLIVGLKKLFSKKDDDDGGHYVKVVGGGGEHGGGGGDHYRRSMLLDAHQLAYRGQHTAK